MDNKMKLKICGMRDPENIRSVTDLAPDFTGFIFYPKSPRYVGEEFVMPADFPSSIKRVGVFVNSSVDEIISKTAKYRLNFAQLHGDETPGQCAELKNNNIRIIKAFSVGAGFDFTKTYPYGKLTDYFLFDTKGANYGGNGKSFDWSILKNYDIEHPYFLSGGLSVENVPEALEMRMPAMFGLDLNSGVELFPGLKAVNKIKSIQKIINTFVS